MKGKILGFSEAEGTGAIAAEDGTRHKFTRADWRGDKTPATGMTVDFESEGGAAKEIYPVGGAALAALGNINVDLSGLSVSPEGAKLAALFTRSLAVPLALVVLLACFMNVLTSPAQSATLFGLGQTLDQLSMVSAAGRMMGADSSGLGTMQTLMFLRFAAPLAALWLIWAAWAGKPEKLPMMAAGAAAILAALLVAGLKMAIVSMAPDFMREQISSGISLGLGVWMLLLAGGALIAAGLGMIRNPLAKE
jgi:hypothetical protein